MFRHLSNLIIRAHETGLTLFATAFGSSAAAAAWPGLAPNERAGIHVLAIPMSVASWLFARWLVGTLSTETDP